ncbi:MAG TPA: outer membrane protein assembly factor BamA [Prolixibacteraceae bacterium]|nr:outer membrane protein assembly factor BamA [Prolixibacteraceae bacterium]
MIVKIPYFYVSKSEYYFMSLKRNHMREVWMLVLLLIVAIHGFGQKDYKVRRISIEGNKTLNDAEIKVNINTKAKSLTGKLKFWEKAPRFSSSAFEDDIQRLNRLYQRNGFLMPEIDYKLNQNDRAKSVRLVILVNEGESVSIDSISFQSLNDSVYQSLAVDKKKDLPAKVGDRFQDEKVKAYEVFLQKKYSDRGYPFSVVTNKVTLLPGNRKADLNFQIDPGAKCYFGPTWIKSDSLVPVSFIRNQLKFHEGELYSKELIEKTQQKLYDTELFQYVVIRTLLDSIKDGRVPISVRMQEKPRWLLTTGAGYGSEDRFRFSGQVTRRQFFGGARRLIFSGKTSYTLPLSLELSFIQPDFLSDNLDLIINPYFSKSNETSYRVERLGSGITFQYNFSKYTTTYLMYSFERDRFNFKSNVPLSYNKQDSLLYNKSGFTIGFTRNTTHDIFNPKSGIRLNSYLTLMGIGMNSKYHYVKLEMEFRQYFPLPNDWVLAGRIRGGGMNPIKGDDATPIEDRFMLGGALSLRGWGRNKISPVNENGDLVGGNSMIEANAELRFPVYDIFSGAFFVDAGNVWKESMIQRITDLRADMGVGIRVSTPIGPVRFDVASPIFYGKFNGLFIVSIGHAF